MAEVQTNTLGGELSQRFIEFVMMQAQNAALFLGQIPNPQTGEGEVNLELARMFIDQLGMIQEKTRGNLTSEEGTVLRNALSNLQMAFVEVSQNEGKGGAQQPRPQASAPSISSEAEAPANAPAAGSQESSASASEPAPPAAAPAESESRKKFTKSYGA